MTLPYFEKSSYDLERELNDYIESVTPGTIDMKHFVNSIVTIAVKRAKESERKCE